MATFFDSKILGHPVARGVLDPIRTLLEPCVGPIVDWADTHSSDLTRNYPLMEDGRDVFALSFLYLLLVPLSLRVLPRVLQPLRLRLFSYAHNALLVSLSTYMAIGTAYYFAKMAVGESRIVCLGVRPGDVSLANVLWVFYASKLYEFVDTFIMVLKGKSSQVTFLHVYHHASIFPYWYLIVRTCPGGDAWLTAFLNSSVHVVMYSYYMLAAMGVRVSWKAWVTRGQMVQFALFLVQSVWVSWVARCHEGAIERIGQGLIAYALSLLALFANFYRKAYAKKGAAAKGKRAGKNKAE